MAFMRASRIAYLHPADEGEVDESLLVKSKRASCDEVIVTDFLALKRWLQDELGAEFFLVPGQGWTRLSSMTRQQALPEEFSIHVRASIHGKRTRATSLDAPTRTGEPSSKRLKAMEEYKPYYVEPDKILGPRDQHFLLADVRWLHLLVADGRTVSLEKLRDRRRDGIKPEESEYYGSVLALLKSASFGQHGLLYTAQGYGNVVRSDLQGFINGERRAACEVKTDLKMATDKDFYGIEANALAIKEAAVELDAGIERTSDAVRLGCLFSRMDRFFILKFDRNSRTVAVTPSFPPAQPPNASPSVLYSTADDFVVLRMAWLDRCTLDKVRLSDVLPAEATPGFRSLVAYVEELQRIYALPPSAVRFLSHQGQEIHGSEMTRLVFGLKSLVLLRRSSNTVIKVCVPEDASNEIRIHKSVVGQENVRRLVSHGRVDVGNKEGVFHFLELEGYGEPLAAKHLGTLEAIQKMWTQAMSALEHLHSNGVLHRDVKPDNMLVVDGVLKVNDFDVSCFKGDGRDASEIVGTDGFQSPSGMLPYAEEDDILSLGLAFYKAQTGVCVPGKEARLHILREELHQDRFPDCMRLKVLSALRTLGLD